MKSKKACMVYWIHLPNANIKTDGYVGITTRGKKRWKEHSGLTSKSHHLVNAINKYKDSLIWEIVYEGSIEGCEQLEEYWRPVPSIGWNIRSGGKYYIMSDETKDVLRQHATSKNVSQETRNKLSAAGKGRPHSEEHKVNLSIANKKAYASPELREKLRQSTLALIAAGKVSTAHVVPGWNKGIPTPEHVKQKLSEINKKRFLDPNIRPPLFVVVADSIQDAIKEDREAGMSFSKLSTKYELGPKILQRICRGVTKGSNGAKVF